MRSNNIDEELKELAEKFAELEIQHRRLQRNTTKDTNKLQGQIEELEETNRKQSSEITRLNQLVIDRKTSRKVVDKKRDKDRHRIINGSIHIGDYVKVTNNYKGQFGTIGKVYNVTKAQVHYKEVRTNNRRYRAFHNVQKINLSTEEKVNLAENGRGNYTKR